MKRDLSDFLNAYRIVFDNSVVTALNYITTEIKIKSK